MSLVMGVLNVTPDSFSDGGRWFELEAAIEHGLRLIAEGADIVDVGGESTRPGAQRVDEAEELRRVVPVVEQLAPHVRVSIDTSKRAVAEAAVNAGASIVNDVSSSLWEVAAESGTGWIAMHMRGDPSTMDRLATYTDVVSEVRAELISNAQIAAAGGVKEIWIDPGIGFAKTARHNVEILARLKELVAAGWPVAVGTSRKRFLGNLVIGADEEPVDVEDRLEGSLVTATWAMLQGVTMVRVHDVAATVQAAKLLSTSSGPTKSYRDANGSDMRVEAR